ncbi:MAG TPA: diguanylate cyclase [Aquabacterium sp.]|uniref:diguanylate cyclase n=1 Tax=Aquabacterium sp. TaxID=1872578 RepID=UPI002E375E08|nr:diguanylate cyclase [Aquabacterium sp.]HEX5355789.1 diguanylate cyclase [Aquabacterium sp.]
MSTSADRHPLSALLLSTDWKQRLRLRRMLTGSLGYLVTALLLHWAAAHGVLPAAPVWAVSGAMLALVALLYIVIRCGWNRRFKDPSLTLFQMLAPASLAGWIYSFSGVWRDAILVALVPVLMFGFRHLSPLKIRLLSAYSMFCIAAGMVWLVHHQPQTYDMGKELVRFMLMAVAVASIWQFSNSDDVEHSEAMQALLNLIFTQDPKQRIRIQRFMVAAVNFLICTVVLAYAASTGAVRAEPALSLGTYMMTTVLTFYVLLRSGINLQFEDPALTMPQIVVALTSVVWAYAILEGSRGAALILLALVLVFGMFNLSARHTRLAALFALTLQGLTMLAMATLDPTRYTVRQELTHFLFACTSLPTISLLSGQLSELRARLQARKEELSQALARIQTLATRDELTGLFNRRHMMESLALQKQFSDSGGRIFCIAILDIDHFKQVNDTYGHGVGDEVLRNFAKTARSVLREADVIARWGGEEFLLMFTDCRLDHAEAGLARVRDAVTHTQVSSTVPELRITFSAGLTEQRYEETLDQSIERADQALYQAKHSGRHRTVTT